MEINKPKAASLYRIFLRYLAVFCVVMILIIATIIFSFYYALAKGVILPANYAEQELQKVEDQLMQSEVFDPSLIPYPSTYVLFGKTGEALNSNMTEKEISRTREYLLGKSKLSSSQYRNIQRMDESSLVIKYDMLAHFSSPMLNKLFPNPELLAIAIFFSCFILSAIVIAFKFSKKIKTELAPLIKATDLIKEKDLNFEIVPTQIRELNTVLQSIGELKVALSDSLNQQWDLEQSKTTQISAIAHDIKTPLTIIRGNTELLLESDLSTADKELLQYIQRSSEKIENYIELLMTAATVKDSSKVQNQPFLVQDFIFDIEKQAKALCHVKNIILCIKYDKLPEIFNGDVVLIGRAVLNIFDNAVEYSKEGSKIEFKITGSDEVLTFTIIDSGKGFTVAGLKNATMEFFTEKIERSGKHYGMGLYIAKSVAEQHNGTIEISNRKDGCGAIVSLIIRNQY